MISPDPEYFKCTCSHVPDWDDVIDILRGSMITGVNLCYGRDCVTGIELDLHREDGTDMRFTINPGRKALDHPNRKHPVMTTEKEVN